MLYRAALLNGLMAGGRSLFSSHKYMHCEPELILRLGKTTYAMRNSIEQRKKGFSRLGFRVEKLLENNSGSVLGDDCVTEVGTRL